MKKNVRSILAFALALSMCLSLLPMGVLAEPRYGVCEHHTDADHTPDCGYVESVAGHECEHVCGSACFQEETNCLHTTHTEECYTDGDMENGQLDCHHVCSLENGCITKVNHCIHESHDDTCGYVEEVAGHSCTFYCEICNHVDVEGVTVDSAITVNVGESATLNAVVTPEDATDKSVSWSSSDTSVATVVDGVVTGLQAGEAVITVTTNDKSFSAECSVTVVPVPVDGVSLNKTELTLIAGFGESLTATVSPTNATDKTVTWSSSKPDVASVADGVVTAVSEGTATITAVTTNGGFEASCAVTVNPFIHVEGVSLGSSAISLIDTKSIELYAAVEPENATNKTLTWTTSDAGVATVENGVVTAKGPGTATITVTSVDGVKTASCTVTVNPFIHVTSVTLDTVAAALEVDGSLTLTATVTPENAHNPGIVWASSDTSVATVAGGVVTAVAPGTATITATSADNGIQASCTVIVAEEIIDVTGITLDQAELTLSAGDSETLIATVMPETATNKAVTWASYNPAVASVDANGQVTALSVGKATITATTVDGRKIDSCAVTVVPAVTEVKLDKTKVTLLEGGTATLTATVLPAEVLNKRVIWSSSDLSVAEVSDTGVITAKKKGTATITATAVGGNLPVARAASGKAKYAECIVTVLPAECTVTFNSNAGTFVASATVKNGAKLTAPAAPTKGGYIFMGWYKDNTLKTPWNFDTDIVTSDMTLYARWDVKYQFNVTYNSNTSRKVHHMPSDETVVTNLDEWTFRISGAKPHRSGYWFAGWNTRADGKGATYKRGSLHTATAGSPNLTLYAQWRRADESNYKTSDDSNIRFWTALLVVSGVSLAAVGTYVLIKRKRK